MFQSRSGILLTILLLMAFALGASFISDAAAQKRFYDRKEIPGNYTIGFYADEKGTSNLLEIDADQETVDIWIGVTGDSTRIFSAAVFRMELPRNVTMDGAIRWSSIQSLLQTDSPISADGTRVEFSQDCQMQTGPLPAILGRFRLSVDPKVKEFELEPLPHRRFGLSLELCEMENDFPKPYAEPRSMKVVRKTSFWKRIKNLFG